MRFGDQKVIGTCWSCLLEMRTQWKDGQKHYLGRWTIKTLQIFRHTPSSQVSLVILLSQSSGLSFAWASVLSIFPVLELAHDNSLVTPDLCGSLPRSIILEKFLLWKVFSLRCLKWLLNFAIIRACPATGQAAALDVSLEKDVVQRIAETWSQKQFIQLAQLNQQACILLGMHYMVKQTAC